MDNSVKIMPKAIVCEESVLRGDITISPGCIIHTSATIIAECGPIILGENCIVEEYATIINKNASEEAEAGGNALIIGTNNVFEVGCHVQAKKIGENNIFECKSYVSPAVSVSSGCVIGAGCRLLAAQTLPEHTVIYSKNCLQRDAMEKQSQALQIESLRKILPNYHHLKKATFDAKKIRGQV
ncbi:unnamed protein product [Hermetia illucens]|uniref:Dynactin subunit 6 n=2 Tax=Hermetia illucens TaxID=343691 RepID=A0A7R8UAX6_HERIL|nr:unnamed protein product [Hermetia illucens]